MTRCTIRRALIATVVIFSIFMLFILQLTLSLDYIALNSAAKVADHGCHSETDGSYRIETMLKQHTDEIEVLKDQIRELQYRLSNKENPTINIQSSKLKKKCLQEMKFSEKLFQTDAIKGRSYTSESHAPIFTRFDMWYQYQVNAAYGMNEARDKLNGLQRIYTDEVVDEAIMYVNASKWRRDHFTEGIYHSSPTIGTHYELNFVNDENERERVTLFRPEAPVVAVKSESVPVSSREKFNIIIPLSGRTDSLLIFLTNFEHLLVKMRYRIFLTIVYFGESLSDLTSVFQSFTAKHKYRSYHIEHVRNRNFSRGYALDVGIRSWKSKADPLLFLCDVDIVFTEEFTERCLTYPQRESRVYYPIVFSLYNPKVIELYFNQRFSKLKDQMKITSNHGFWRHFGFGMVCLYRSDYLKSSGFKLDLKEWGEEDVLLFRSFVQSNISVIRAPDPHIFHLWHHKQCDKSLSDEHYRACIKSKTFSEGSHTQLGYIALKDDIGELRRGKHQLT